MAGAYQLDLINEHRTADRAYEMHCCVLGRPMRAGALASSDLAAEQGHEFDGFAVLTDSDLKEGNSISNQETRARRQESSGLTRLVP